MARAIHKLTDTYVRSKNLKRGRHGDGGGLYLNVSKAGTKSWVYLWRKNGRLREMGLGGYPTVTLSAARVKSSDARSLVHAGKDPIAEKKAGSEPTFGECADKFINQMESSWKSEVHRRQWRTTLTEYCRPIREKPVSVIDTSDVLRILQPIWNEKPETASRLRGRIERVLEFAKVNGWREGENPALWRGHLRGALPRPKKLVKGHHPAMPYKGVPDFIRSLRSSSAVSARLLEFLILTAVRASEAREAQWQEFRLADELWVIPGDRTKSGRAHTVPLSAQATNIVSELSRAAHSDFVFPGQKWGSPLSPIAVPHLMERMKLKQYTVHGFRSSFRDWCGEETDVPREIAEMALGHKAGSEVELAYRRETAIEKRRLLMQDWSDYCCLLIGGVIKTND